MQISRSPTPRPLYPKRQSNCTLKQLKRADVPLPHAQLLHCYLTVIGLWVILSSSLTSLTKKSHVNQIESVQKHIILSAFGMPYTSTLYSWNCAHDHTQGPTFKRFLQLFVLLSSSCWYCLLLPSRYAHLLSRLSAPSKFHRISHRAKKYQSLISFVLAHYQ